MKKKALQIANGRVDHLQRFLKTDVRYLLRGGFWLSAGQLATSVSAFILSVSFANLVAKEIYGTYTYILSVGEIIGVISLTGVSTAIIRSAAKGNAAILWDAFILSLKWSFGILMVGAGVAAYYFFNENYILAVSILLSAGFLPLLNGFKLYDPFLIGKRNFKSSTKYNQLRAYVPTLSLVAGILLQADTIILIAIFYFAHTVANGVAYYLTLKKYHSVGTDNTDTDFNQYSGHLSILNIFTKIVEQSDKILVFQFIGAAELAIYYIALTAPRQVASIFKHVRALALPKLSKQKLSVLQETLPSKVKKMYLLIIPLVVSYILIAPYIYELFFPKYLESVIYSQVYILSMLFIPINLYYHTLTTHARTKELYIITISTGILKLVLLFSLLQLLGVWAVLISLLSSQALQAAELLYMFKRLKENN